MTSFQSNPEVTIISFHNKEGLDIIKGNTWNLFFCFFSKQKFFRKIKENLVIG